MWIPIMGTLYIFTLFHSLLTISLSVFMIFLDLFPCLLTTPSVRARPCFVLFYPPVYS